MIGNRKNIEIDSLYETLIKINKVLCRLSTMKPSTYESYKEENEEFDHMGYSDNNSKINGLYKKLFNGAFFRSEGLFETMQNVHWDLNCSNTEKQNMFFIMDKMFLSELNDLRFDTNIQALEIVKNLVIHLLKIHDVLYKYNIVSKSELIDFRDYFDFEVNQRTNNTTLLSTFSALFDKLFKLISSSDAECLNAGANKKYFLNALDKNNVLHPHLKKLEDRYNFIKCIFNNDLLIRVSKTDKAFRYVYKHCEESFSSEFIRDFITVKRYNVLIRELQKVYGSEKSIIRIIVESGEFEDVPSKIALPEIIKMPTSEDIGTILGRIRSSIDKDGLHDSSLNTIANLYTNTIFNIDKFATKRMKKILKIKSEGGKDE